MPTTKSTTSTPQSKRKSGSSTPASQPSGLNEHPFSTKRGDAKSKSGTDKQAGGRKGHQ